MLLVFHFGGYRTLAAAVLALLAALVLISASGLRRRGAGAGGGCRLPLFWLPKGSYLATALAALAGLAGALGHWRRARGAAGGLLWASAVRTVDCGARCGWFSGGRIMHGGRCWALGGLRLGNLAGARRAGWWRVPAGRPCNRWGLVLLLAWPSRLLATITWVPGLARPATIWPGAGRTGRMSLRCREPSAMLANGRIGRFIDVYYWRNRRAGGTAARCNWITTSSPYARLIAPRSPQGMARWCGCLAAQPAAGALTVQLLAQQRQRERRGGSAW